MCERQAQSRSDIAAHGSSFLLTRRRYGSRVWQRSEAESLTLVKERAVVIGPIGYTYRIEMKAHGNLIITRILNSMQAQPIRHVRNLPTLIRRSPGDLQRTGF